MFNQLRGTTAPLPADEVAAASRTVRRLAHAAPPRVRRSGGPRLGAGEHLRRLDVSGARGAVRGGRRADGPWRPGRAGSCWCAARTARCGRSPTSAGTAATSCCRAAATASKRSRSSARTTAGRYGLDGSLRNAPRLQRRRGLRPSPSSGCAELRVVEWHGWVFVDPSGEAGRFDDHVAGLEQVVGHYRARGPRHRGARTPTSSTTNWKIIVENYQECYHCPSIHPELCRVSPPTERREPRARRRVDRRLDGPDARRGRPCRSTARSGGVAIAGLDRRRAAHGDVRRRVPQPADQPAPRLRDDPHAARRSPPDRTYVECSWAFPARRPAEPRLRPVVRRRLLGPHQPPGLGGLRVGAARPHQPARDPRAAGARGGRRLPVRQPAWVARTPASAAPTTPARR